MGPTDAASEAALGASLRRHTVRGALIVLLCTIGIGTGAVEISGVEVADEAEVAGRTLALNGAGVRSKFFVRIYVGSLYLPARSSEAAKVIAMAGPKRVRLDMIYSSLSAEQVTDAWNDGFEANLSAEVRERLAPRIEAFNALWPTLNEGDRVLLDFSDANGTTLVINGTALGAVPGKDFNDAMLRIWLGDAPVDGDLKHGMLGG